MAFNTITSISGQDKVFTEIINQINVDAINVKVMPAGTSPNVVYRVGDGTVHPDGFENTLDYKYIDFYVSTGAQGIQGEKGEDGQSAYTQAVANGYTGTQSEFYALLTNVAQNAIDADASATAAATSATAAALSESNASTSETNASASASSASTSASNAATSESNASTSASNASTSETNASNSATSASTSASAASTSEINAATSEANTAALYDMFDDRFLGSKASDPTLDNDGDTLQAGTLYYNATAGEIRVYSGSTWDAITVATTLDGLTDVNTTGVGDNYLLSYNATSGNWEAVAAASGLTITLTGSSTGQESTDVVITNSNHDADTSYLVSVDFGSVVDNADGTFTVSLPDYSVATSVTLTVHGDKIGEADGTATHVIAVTNTQVAQPDFTGSVSAGSESTTIQITDIAYEATATYTFSIVGTPAGSSITHAGSGVYDVTLPAYATATSITVTIYGSRANDIDSNTTNYPITVNEVTAVADDAIVDDLTTDVINDGF